MVLHGNLVKVHNVNVAYASGLPVMNPPGLLRRTHGARPHVLHELDVVRRPQLRTARVALSVLEKVAAVAD